MADKCDLQWLLGRGASIDCGLKWTVPIKWRDLPREKAIQKIKNELNNQMCNCDVDPSVYRRFLALLSNSSKTGWKHKFHTTNWDFLLQKEIDQLFPEVCPKWLRDTWVSHLNGSIQKLEDESQRSKFLLEWDPPEIRFEAVKFELKRACVLLAWSQLFVVIGMSFECKVDNSLLKALSAVPLPIESSTWLVVNPKEDDLRAVCQNIQTNFPRANVEGINSGFKDWISAGMPELKARGIY